MRLFPHQIQLAIEKLKRGEVIAFPTETVYGLAAPIFNEEAVAKIFQAKGRAADNPLIAHIATVDQVDQIAIHIPQDFYRLAEKFFPGPLTVVLQKHRSVPLLASGGLATIGVRMPRHPIALELIAGVGEPLVAPSANLSGKPSSTTADHVLADFGETIGGVIDGGASEYGIESTVIRLSPRPCLLRPGAISKEEIEETLGISLQEGRADALLSSPGTRYKHYAPSARLTLFTNRQQFIAYISCNHQIFVGDGVKRRDLYEFLRCADDAQVKEIALFCTEEMQRDLPLMDRLRRAALLI